MKERVQSAQTMRERVRNERKECARAIFQTSASARRKRARKPAMRKAREARCAPVSIGLSLLVVGCLVQVCFLVRPGLLVHISKKTEPEFRVQTIGPIVCLFLSGLVGPCLSRDCLQRKSPREDELLSGWSLSGFVMVVRLFMLTDRKRVLNKRKRARVWFSPFGLFVFLKK